MSYKTISQTVQGDIVYRVSKGKVDIYRLHSINDFYSFNDQYILHLSNGSEQLDELTLNEKELSLSKYAVHRTSCMGYSDYTYFFDPEEYVDELREEKRRAKEIESLQQKTQDESAKDKIIKDLKAQIRLLKSMLLEKNSNTESYANGISDADEYKGW